MNGRNFKDTLKCGVLYYAGIDVADTKERVLISRRTTRARTHFDGSQHQTETLEPFYKHFFK